MADTLISKFIDLLIERSKQKPRKANARSLLRLRRSLIECHDAYVRFITTADLKAKPPRMNGRLMDRWRHALHNLMMDMGEISEILEIFEPGVSTNLVNYLYDEVIWSLRIDPLADLAVDLNVQLDNELLADAYYTSLPDEPGDSSLFEHALLLLDDYIRTSYTADEIRAVVRRRRSTIGDDLME